MNSDGCLSFTKTHSKAFTGNVIHAFVSYSITSFSSCASTILQKLVVGRKTANMLHHSRKTK